MIACSWIYQTYIDYQAFDFLASACNADIISNYCNTAPKQWLGRCEIIDNTIEENEGYTEELTWLVVC